jgi:hypothetical protein
MNDMLPKVPVGDGVWVEAPPGTFRKGDYRHPPFGEAYRPFFEKMSQLFAEFGMGSPEGWEDDFRRDRNPEREMSLWKQLAEFYEHFLRGGEWALERKRELFRLLLTCMSGGGKYALRKSRFHHLSRRQARDIVNHVTKATGGQVWPIVIGDD